MLPATVQIKITCQLYQKVRLGAIQNCCLSKHSKIPPPESPFPIRGLGGFSQKCSKSFTKDFLRVRKWFSCLKGKKWIIL